jgi:hypothetical protein
MKPIPIEIDVDAAHTALGDAIAWWELHRPKAIPRDHSVEALLRSASLEALARTALHGVYGEHPRFEAANAATWRENFEHRRRADEILLIETFPRLVALRRESLERSGVARPPKEAILHEWRRPRSLLLFSPSSTLSDAAAWVASRGFLDGQNAPPWDSWLALADVPRSVEGQCLLSWVPEWARDLVDRGIAVNPEQCIAWAEVSEAGVFVVDEFA